MGGKQSSNASTSGLQTQAEPPPGPSSSNRIPHGARRSTVTIGSLGQQHRRQMFGHNQSENYVLFDAHLSRTNSNNETGLQIPRRGFEWLYTNHHEDSDSSPDDDTSASRIFARAFSQRNPARSLPPYLISPMRDARCPMCGKMIPAEDVEVHFVMCLTKPRVTYNEDILSTTSGECAICLEDLEQGESIARLPCLCIYHKTCIDQWFLKSQTCPEHPPD